MRMPLNRRSFIKTVGTAGTATLLTGMPGVTYAVTTPSERAPKLSQPEQRAVDAVIRPFMERFKVPGLSIAVGRQGRFLFNQALGLADETTQTPLSTESVFRVASISKSFTAVAIFSLIEQGRLRLTDLVFGEKGTLGFDFGKTLPSPVNELTIGHLLTHRCGGWTNKAQDPMFQNPAMNHRELIEWTIQNVPLTEAPGKTYAYSNFGYCILGRVIEKLTALPYQQAVQRDVLAKCGITTMRIAGNTLADKAPGEVTYHDREKDFAYKMNVVRMDSHGGWMARASDLVHFLMRVDGISSPADILRANTIKVMTTPVSPADGYAYGWLAQGGHWWHGGKLPGTATIMSRMPSGLCWSALANTETEELSRAMIPMMLELVKAVPAWRA